MVKREFWRKRVESAWAKRSVVWLKGVRRVGKTSLAQGLDGVEYFDCELPRVRRALEDPEGFWQSRTGRRIVLDEVHRLSNPSEVLKIAADHFPRLQVLATGSSTLGASARFRDTLAGRKLEVWMTPMVSSDVQAFGGKSWDRRLLHGGLPAFYLSEKPPEVEFQEWMDAYWAKDIQELFRLERRASLQRFLELLFAQSGGIFEATKFAGPCEVSRTTITNYLAVLEATMVAMVLRPFSTRRSNEILAAPKVYGFDTGFVCAHRGWSTLRSEDRGILWEHLVLNELIATQPGIGLRYWRDKAGHELDFVIVRRGRPPLGIECKWSAADFDPGNAQVFARAYPNAEIVVVTAETGPAYRQEFAGVPIEFLALADLPRRMGTD